MILKASLKPVGERDTVYIALVPKSMSLTESCVDSNKVDISDSQILITSLLSSNLISGELSLISSTIKTAELSTKELGSLHS